MRLLTPSALKICDAAVGHFAECGYAGASLSHIAEMAGIRKASIYAHFSGKDELFLSAYELVLGRECVFLDLCFKGDKKSKLLPGYSYCKAMKRHFDDGPNFKFLLSGAYFQPQHLRAELDAHYKFYLKTLGQLFRASYKATFGGTNNLELFLKAYLGIADSLHAELLYAGVRSFDKRFLALWKIFSDSISLQNRALEL